MTKSARLKDADASGRCAQINQCKGATQLFSIQRKLKRTIDSQRLDIDGPRLHTGRANHQLRLLGDLLGDCDQQYLHVLTIARIFTNNTARDLSLSDGVRQVALGLELNRLTQLLDWHLRHGNRSNHHLLTRD